MIKKVAFPHPLTGAVITKNACEAIALGLKPEPLPEINRHSVAAYISAAQQSILSDASSIHGLCLQDTIEQFAYALFQHHLRGGAAAPSAPARSEQEIQQDFMLGEIDTGVRAGQVVIIEGATGIGKSRVLAKATEGILSKNSRSVVWLAAPTISVLTQLHAEFEKWAPGTAPALLLGKANFISVRRVRATLAALEADGDTDSAEERAAVDAWLASGAPPLTEQAKRLSRIIPGVSHLFDDLASICPQVADRSAQFSGASTDNAQSAEPASALLADMEDTALNARVVLCTHAMLLLKTAFLKEGADAPFTHLLIDEVHELEEWAAGMESTELSLYRLRAWLKAHKPRGWTKAADSISALMERIAGTRVRDGHLLGVDLVGKVRETLSPMAKMIESCEGGEAEDRIDFVEAIRRMSSENKTRMGISLSPVRRYPSVFCGPVSVAGKLSRLWGLARAAVGVSGTIFVPNATGTGITAGYMTYKLSVPNSRLRVVGPVTPRWGTTTPLVLLPGESVRAKLCYPGRVDEKVEGEEVPPGAEEFDAWIEGVAAQVARAASDAAGGMLVLCNSHYDAGELRKRLALALGDRLVSFDRGVSTNTARSAFVAKHRAGIKPVWLGTGPVWTGLNLSDDGVPAARDTLLTDLVIVRVPFGANRSSTQRTRRRAFGFLAETFEAAIRLRQGIGRLVRRKGVHGRRLWILDGRLVTPGVENKRFHSFLRLLTPFSHRATFDADGTISSHATSSTSAQ